MSVLELNQLDYKHFYSASAVSELLLCISFHRQIALLSCTSSQACPSGTALAIFERHLSSSKSIKLGLQAENLLVSTSIKPYLDLDFPFLGNRSQLIRRTHLRHLAVRQMHLLHNHFHRPH